VGGVLVGEGLAERPGGQDMTSEDVALWMVAITLGSGVLMAAWQWWRGEL
jgi:hypothetical protein